PAAGFALKSRESNQLVHSLLKQNRVPRRSISQSDLEGVLQPAMFCFAKKLDDPSLLWAEKKYLQNFHLPIRADMRLHPLVLIWGKTIATSQITVPKANFWAGGGKTPVALMRSSWTDPKAIYVGIKGGSASTNHSHMDVGSFIMEADGVRWALDFGKQDYESLESKNLNIWTFNQDSDRWKVFRYHNLSHNTLTVNNKLQDVKGFAPITSFAASPKFSSAVIDLSSLYPDLKEAKRGIAIVDSQIVAVRDQYIASDKPSVVRWTMLTSASVKIKGRRKIVLTQEGKQLILNVKGDKRVRLGQWSTKSSNSFDANNEGTTLIGYEIDLKPGENATNTVFLIPKSVKRVPKALLSVLERWN
ncbi:MAG: heparinase, partial [Chryseobacterium sp.]